MLGNKHEIEYTMPIMLVHFRAWEIQCLAERPRGMRRNFLRR